MDDAFWIVGGFGAATAATGLGLFMRSRQSTSARWIETLAGWQQLEASERITRIEDWINQGTHGPSERAAALMAKGCAWLDKGYPERAARPFQMAYHQDPDYTIAMVMAFACMKVNSTSATATLEKTLETWLELRRPALGRSRGERAFLTACKRGAPPPGATPLALAIWSLPADSLRRQITVAMSERPAWSRPLWGHGADSTSR